MGEQQHIIIEALVNQLSQLDQDFRKLEALEVEQSRRVEQTRKELSDTATRLNACRAALEAYEDSLQNPETDQP
ncbi:hypothetical protein ODZ83_11015 [Acaricomes phytoseiuli]|uniref:hypothetical protein n=1 Tax=Acaricomes phytoseiuli TaxID=291968 RepID=UPI0003656F9D|nr:hypothetical protein [Acaricomes phytoseiuli]MCW1250692.1 hypothetical protein [Acaricomes phytoseiuli]